MTATDILARAAAGKTLTAAEFVSLVEHIEQTIEAWKARRIEIKSTVSPADLRKALLAEMPPVSLKRSLDSAQLSDADSEALGNVPGLDERLDAISAFVM